VSLGQALSRTSSNAGRGRGAILVGFSTGIVSLISLVYGGAPSSGGRPPLSGRPACALGVLDCQGCERLIAIVFVLLIPMKA
jgi:hypothetical protein